MNNQYTRNEDEEMNPRNVNSNNVRPLNVNNIRVEDSQYSFRGEQGQGDFMNNLLNNPKEAIAKEVMERAQQKISQSWLDKCKCNFEYGYKFI